ncbi:MAG: amino acid ABC transporter permease [Verrucomicrobia bacterium]|nr:amino acid ABC transporter permease [Verrucomicrobiota bacterium]
MIDFSLIVESLPALLKGAWSSIQITIIAAAIGLSLGIVLGFAEKASSVCVRACVYSYVTLFRGTPMLMQILFVYYVLPQFGIMIDPFWAASIAIGLNSSAYISQIILTGINAVPQGQIEAAQVLGLSSFHTMQYIIFPQSIRTSLPALGNELVTLVKDSSLASIIGVVELSKEASLIRSRTYDAFSILLATSLIYLALTLAISFFIKREYACSSLKT